MSSFELGVIESEAQMPPRSKMAPDLAHYGKKYDEGADCHWCSRRTPQVVNGSDCEVIQKVVEPGYACDYFQPVRTDG